MPAQRAIQLLYPSAQRSVAQVTNTPQQAPVPTSPGRPDVAGDMMSAAELLGICPPPEYEALPGLRLGHELAMALLRTQRLLLRRHTEGLRLEGDTTLIGALLRQLEPTTELSVEWLESDAPPYCFAYPVLIARPQDGSWVEARVRQLVVHWGAKGDIRGVTAAALGITKEGLRKRSQRTRTAK